MATAIVLGLVTAAMLATSDQQLRDAEALIDVKKVEVSQAVAYAVKTAESRLAQLITYYAQNPSVAPTVAVRVADTQAAFDKLSARFTAVGNTYLVSEVVKLKAGLTTAHTKYSLTKTEAARLVLLNEIAYLFPAMEALKDYIDSWLSSTADQEYYLITQAEATFNRIGK